jgi:Flp pilus assembly protein TadD
MSSVSPESVQAAVEAAVSLQKAGQTDAAERLYRQVLQSRPDHSEANHNLGIISMQRGKLAAGVAYFKQAMDADGDRDLYRRSYARSLVLSGQGALAAKVLEANELLLHGNALTEEGNFSRAIESFKHAIALNPELSEAYHRLGSLLAETGRVAEGFDYLMKRVELAKGRGTARQSSQSEPPHKTKHDGEQHAYLIAQGRIPTTAPAKDFFHMGDGARLGSSALNRNHLTAAGLEEWRNRVPQLVVVDDFLARPALEQLRRFCADSTVWRRVYDAGYIGATPADGFACPLLAQITEEISSVYSDLLGGHPFRYLGAFKYDSELSTGTNIHADYSAINLNLYITPDEANSDPDTGGMMIWNVAARDERELRRYNSSDSEIREYLRHSRAQSIRVAHRANRAVFFKSSLFHKTDTCRFREGYLNKRINVSFLFGQFGSATPGASE